MSTLLGTLIVIGIIALLVIVPYLLGCLITLSNPFKNDYGGEIFLFGWFLLVVISSIVSLGYIIGNEFNL